MSFYLLCALYIQMLGKYLLNKDNDGKVVVNDCSGISIVWVCTVHCKMIATSDPCPLSACKHSLVIPTTKTPAPDFQHPFWVVGMGVLVLSLLRITGLE